MGYLHAFESRWLSHFLHLLCRLLLGMFPHKLLCDWGERSSTKTCWISPPRSPCLPLPSFFFFFSPRIASYSLRTENVHCASLLCWLYIPRVCIHLVTAEIPWPHSHASSYLSRYEDACDIGNNGRGLMKMTRRTLSVQDGGWVFDCISSPPS